MSFFDCVNDAIDEGSLDRDRGHRAQGMWKERVKKYEAEGYTTDKANALAAEDVIAYFDREAAMSRHANIASMANQMRQSKAVEALTDDLLARDAVQAVEIMEYRTRGLKRRFDDKIGAYLKQNHRDIWGRNKDPINQMNVVKEMRGESTGDNVAYAYAQAVHHALEDMRLQANAAGASIRKLENYYPQGHDRTTIIKAGIDRYAAARGMGKTRAKMTLWKEPNRQQLFQNSFDQWFDDIAEDMDWTKIEDRQTGQMMQAENGTPPTLEDQQRVLRAVFDSIVYGDAVKEGVQGSALYKALSQERILHFKTTDGFVKYNKKYGSGDPHKTLISHVHLMAKDIVAMRDFGPNPNMGIQFRGRKLAEEAKKRGMDPSSVEANVAHAERMMRVHRGPAMPSGYFQTLSANFFSTTRQALTSAFLDRAVIASISDLNSAKVASQAIGGSRDGPFQTYIRSIANMAKEGSLTTDEMRQWHWIADTMADPGVQVARFNSEMPAAEWVERLSSGVMRAQGLSQHTDAGRFAMHQAVSGQFAQNIGKSLNDMDPGLLAIMREHGITDEEWAKFSNGQGVFEAENGAKFLNPLYWREATDLPAKEADDLFLKFQGVAEDVIEVGVPTQSLYMRGWIDPVAWEMTPGSPLFEVAKSGGMFKSFVMAFTYNQYRSVRRMPAESNPWLWAAESVAGATIMGATALQITELLKGNDPLSMDNAGFWGEAALKGGGFAIVGDLIAQGETNWGGGFGSYVAGPIPQAIDDAWDLTVGNLIELGAAVMTGEDVNTKFPKELKRAFDRYTPAKDLPMFGIAFDRLVADQIYSALDPEGRDALLSKAQKRENRDGNGSFWMPGSPLPDRSPDLTGLIGG